MVLLWPFRQPGEIKEKIWLDQTGEGGFPRPFPALSAKMSGVELIQQVRQKDNQRKLAVIVVSGENDPEMVMDAFKAGADAFVVKPFSPKTIGDKIAQVFSQRGR